MLDNFVQAMRSGQNNMKTFVSNLNDEQSEQWLDEYIEESEETIKKISQLQPSNTVFIENFDNLLVILKKQDKLLMRIIAKILGEDE